MFERVGRLHTCQSPRLKRHWQGVFSLADQAIVSGMSFTTTVLLGRWCGAGELGAYALAFTIWIFALNAQMSLISIPYTNQWRWVPQKDRRAFAGCALLEHGLLAILGTLLLLAVVVVLRFSGVGNNFARVLPPLALVLPMLLAREFVRRFAFAHLHMRTAMCLDFAVALFQFSGLVFLRWTGHLSARTALVALGIGAGAGSGLMLVVLRRSFSIRWGMLRDSMSKHWRFGRWVFASVSVTVIQGYSIHWCLAAFQGSLQTGVFAACLAVVQISNPLWLGIGNLLEPRLAKTLAELGLVTLRRSVVHVTIALSGLAAIFVVVLVVQGDTLVELLYNQSEYNGHTHLITVLAFVVSIGALDGGINHGLRAMDRPDFSFRASVLALIVTLVSGLFLVPHYGIVGGAYAMLAAEICGVGTRIGAFFYLTSPRRPRIAAVNPIGEVGGPA
ncbi:MAG: lipopolysaccharide biosynthesis protein [Planctomycetota bacterium]